MRQSIIASLFVAGLVAAVGLLVAPSLLGEDEPPTMTWSATDEVAVAPIDGESAVAEGAEAEAGSGRVELAADDTAADRTDVMLRGRVVDRYHGPVADARVWLDFGRGGQRDRGGRERRVPEPVRTDADGRFAFAGQTFRNLRVSLLVVHGDHAPSHFERNLGEVTREMDLGELAVLDGGELIGRVIDLDGNPVVGAEVRLQPENENRMRFQRDRDSWLTPATVDGNGYYRFGHVAAGDWRVSATASRHQNGSSDTLPVEEAARVDVEDIRLGPGFEITGLVSDALGAPVADAEVIARPRREQREQASPGERGAERGGRGNRGGGNRGGQQGGDHRTRTNAQGRFALDHLPGAPLDLTVRKEGYLTFQQAGIDSKTTPPLYVKLEDGLVIAGAVTDAVTGAPVLRYAVSATWVRGLDSERAEAEAAEIMLRLRDSQLDETTRRDLRQRIEGVRREVAVMGNDVGRGPDRRGAGGRRMKDHPGGRFRETGLQEGVYTLTLESGDHAVWHSSEIELRLGAVPPEVPVALDRGFRVTGVVRGSDGAPIANADVELRTASADEAARGDAAAGGGPGGRGRRGRGGDGMRQFFAGSGAVIATATTDRSGAFALEHAAAGNYRVAATAKGRDNASTAMFALAADRGDVELVLGALGALKGRILGVTADEITSARVVAVPIGDGGNFGAMFRGNGQLTANAQSDGSYAFDTLAPGAYFVRAVSGNGMRELFSQFAGQFAGGELPADITVRAGETAKLDMTLLRSRAGAVRGTVLHNGTAAAGFQINLRRNDDASVGAPGPAGRGFPGGMGGNFNGTVDAQGSFQLGDVPAGSYQLTVSADRRSGTLHTETVVVVAQDTATVTIGIATASIQGQVTATDGTVAADLDGTVLLLPGVTEVPDDLAALRRNAGSFRARVQDGAFAVEMLPPGNYLAVLQIRGRARATAPVVAAIGQSASVAMVAGAVAPAAAAPATPDGEPGPGRRGRGR